MEYNAMLNGEKPLSRVSNWRNDNDIKLIQSVQDGSYKKNGPPKLVDDIDIVYINPSEVNEISNAYRGTVNGVVINLYLNSDKKIISAFPYLE